jgi:hypothetical protein
MPHASVINYPPLREHGFILRGVRDAADRPGREFVFLAQRPPRGPSIARPVPPPVKPTQHLPILNCRDRSASSNHRRSDADHLE